MKACHCGKPFIWASGERSTLVGYYSPPGHAHDDNCLVRRYRCEDGHDTNLSVRRSCPACDWKGKEDCPMCHDGPKLDKWPELMEASHGRSNGQ